MERQINVFNKGINSDLSPMYHTNDMWTFPTVNARFYNTGKGFACLNLPGNTNSPESYTEEMPLPFDNAYAYSVGEKCVYENKVYRYIETIGTLPIPTPPDVNTWAYDKDYYAENYYKSSKGSDIVLKDRYSLIGADETNGVAFLCSVSMDYDRLEIGCFPSPNPTTRIYERVYRPLVNIIGDLECNFINSSTFNWNVDNLLRIEGSVEYDKSVNLYICSGVDLLRCVNSGFDVYSGAALTHRYYDALSFEEQTRTIATQPITNTKHIVSSNDIVILPEGGDLPYGQYIFYLRFADSLGNVTKWLYESKPVSIGVGTDDNNEGYIHGGIYGDEVSEQSVEITIPVSDTFKEIEVGFIYNGTDNNFKLHTIKGVLNETIPIYKGDTFKTVVITTIDASVTSEWDGEETTEYIELIPGDIMTMNNMLYQANMSNQTIDENLIREFIKRVKLKCHVHHGDLPMPTDDVIANDAMSSRIEMNRISIELPITALDYIDSDERAVLNTRTYKFFNDDYLRHQLLTETTGYIDILLNDTDNSITLEGKYAYINKTIVGDEYVYDFSEEADLAGYTIKSDLTGDAFSILYSYYIWEYENTNVYDKGYAKSSETLTDGDVVYIRDIYTAYVYVENYLEYKSNYRWYPGLSYMESTDTVNFTRKRDSYISTDVESGKIYNDTYRLPVDAVKEPGKQYLYSEDYVSFEKYTYTTAQQWQDDLDAGYLYLYPTRKADYYSELTYYYSTDGITFSEYSYSNPLKYTEDEIAGYIYMKLQGNYFIVGDADNMWKKTYRLYDMSSGIPLNYSLAINNEEVSLISDGNNDIYVFGENTEDIYVENDSFYSKKEHIMNDVGYFGGEIYAYAIVAEDKYGNKFGPYPCTGIDHYYANKLSDLEYTAYDVNGELVDDEVSYYSEGTTDRLFKKNQQGIYRFPCRANYIKTVDIYNMLKREEDISEDIEDYSNDAFNLTQRIKVDDAYSNVINIFKICFDFTEAYNWLTGAVDGVESSDLSNLLLLRNTIVKFTFVRAERSGRADNLIAQGIIQKPNTIIPFPKWYELEKLDFDVTQSGLYSHNSFERLISYNFETIYNNCSKNGKIGSTYYIVPNGTERVRLNLHGQLGNSSIKCYDETDNDINDVMFPNEFKNIKTIYDVKICSPKAFIYSGKYAHHAVDFYWDGIYIDNSNQDHSYQIGGNTYRVPPSLGAVSFSSITASNVRDYIINSGCIDAIWGEMSGQIYETYSSTHKYNMYPQNNIFTNKLKYVYHGYNYYDYKLTVEQSVPIDEYEGQYCHLQQHPLMISGGGIKIPFFKGYMPCLHRAGRYTNILDYAKYAYTRFYTTRCMYHPYDLTRAFFSPDIIFKKFYDIAEDVRYIKPIRKTIYSGLEGVVGYVHGEAGQNIDITNSYFKPDCWKTFFARPGQMAFNLKPFDTDNADDFNIKQDWLTGKITDFNALMEFFSHKPIGDSKIRMHQNPVSLMHSVRKYFKIESPRECMPINFCNLIENKRPNSFNIALGTTSGVNIDGYRNSDYYIDHAYDFTVNAASDAPITMNNIESKTYGMNAKTTWNKYGGGERTSTLWASMDNVSSLVGYKGSFFASNRTFKMVPYFSLGFDISNSVYTPENEYPNTVTGSYRNMLDYTQQYYDRYVKLSQFHIKNRTIDWDTSERGTVSRTDDRNNNDAQYSIKDIYVDKVYEDLTLVNLYKNNPENISDITTYYSYSTEMYYEIGSCLSTDVILKRNNNNPVRTQIHARGDCFLDRVYFKHTSWLPTRLGLGTNSFNGSGTWNDRKVDTNWEEPGATNEGGYGSYAPYFTQATTGYSHGVTIGVITENKYNVAMRGQFDIKTMNAYPYSSNMPNETSSSDFMSRAKRKNIFMVYPEAGIVSGGLTFTMYEAYEFNDAYNRMLGYISYAMENSKIKFINKNFNNRIRWSYKKIEGSYIDGWKQFDYANYHDYDQKYGPIKRIENFNGLLFSMMNNGILRHDFEGKEIQVTPEQMLSVGGNRFLTEDTFLMSVLGLSHKFGMIKTSTGIYGVDTNKDTIWAIQTDGKTAGVVSISKTLGIFEWMKEYGDNIRNTIGYKNDVTDVSTVIPDTIYDGLGVTVGYDGKYNEVLFTFKNSYRDWTICYSELLSKFTSLYSFNPYMYFNIQDNIYSVMHKEKDGYEAKYIYRHNNINSYRQHFYNSFLNHDFNISIIINGIAGQSNYSTVAKQFQALTIESQQEPFTRIYYETKDQKADYLFIDTDKWWTHPEYLSHHWQVPIQIDNISTATDEDMYYKDSSMLGDWLKLTLIYSPTKRNKEINIQSIATDFSLSFI